MLAESAASAVPEAPNLRKIFSARSHLSGVSIRIDPGAYREGRIIVNLYRTDDYDPEPIRTVEIDVSKLDSEEPEHLYWELLEKSKGVLFLLRLEVSGSIRSDLWPQPRLLDAKLIHSQPEPYESLPQALLWSPVSQCDLNCTHCISRPTRSKLRFASQRAWEAVAEITRGSKFAHLAMDYSGDILFVERRYPGTLAKVIALNANFRIDTNANCLDDDITEMLFASRMYEINFSIDSMDPEIYRRIRRGSIPLPQVLDKIERFMARKRAAEKEIHTIISFALMRSNAKTIKPAIAFARDNKIDHVNVVPMLAFTEDMLDEIFVWDETAFAELHDELTTEARRLGVALAIQEPVKHWRDEDIHAPCEIPWATAAITANGDVMACCMPGTVLGNLKEQSLAEIWNGQAFSAFRKRVNSPNPPTSCRNCGMGTALVRNNRRAYAPVRYGVSK